MHCCLNRYIHPCHRVTKIDHLPENLGVARPMLRNLAHITLQDENDLRQGIKAASDNDDH